MKKSSVSISGKKWCDLNPSDRDILAISQHYDVSLLIAKLMLNRKIDFNLADGYLNPTIKNLLKDPSLLIDMDKAIERLIEAIERKQKVVIYADYDVDGATSSAILRRYFNEIGFETGLYIPDRIDEGYGANSKALGSLKNKGTDLVIMCDCGTTSFEALEHAHKIGLDIIVLDHHTAEVTLPPHFALINPFRLDQPAEGKELFSQLCTAGLAFVFLAALNRGRRLKGLNPLPDILQYLDLVALGTVCDVMPLKSLNRAFVAQGLKVLNKRKNVGIVSLMDVASIFSEVTAYHLGFTLGPRINAGGRVGKADLGSLLLTANDSSYSKEIAEKLNFYNAERQTLESIVLAQAYEIIEDQKLFEKPVILVRSKDWHPGVIGIVASRIKDKYNKPTIVVSVDEKGEGKGSGRSIPGVELGHAMHDAVHQGLLIKGGGHAMAVGLTIDQLKWGAFESYLCEKFGQIVGDYVPLVNIDHTLSVEAITVDLAKELLKLEPYGQGNVTPKFKVENVNPAFIMPVGDGHFRITFKNQAGQALEAMAFRIRGTLLEDVLKNPNHKMHIAGTIKYDTWNGREKVSFFLEDVMLLDGIS